MRLRDNDFWTDNEVTITNQKTDKKAKINQAETIKLINKIKVLHGNVPDIGERNYFTEILESKYSMKIDSTEVI